MAQAGSKRKRLSKSKKKNWNKVDITDVEEYLEDKRLQERTGGLLAEKTDEQLFFIEKSTSSSTGEPVAKKRKRQPKELKCHSALLPDSRIAPARVKHNVRQERPPPAYLLQEKATSRVSAKEKMAQVQRKQAETNRQRRIAAKAQPAKPAYDLWTDTPAQDEGSPDEHFLKVTKKMKIKAPVTYTRKPSELPAVEVSHPGASYNPTYQDHQDLLGIAHEIEVKKEKEELKLKRALDDKFPDRASAPTEASYIEEMAKGLMEDSSDEEDEQGAEDEDAEERGITDSVSNNPPVRRENKKSARDRRKEKAKKLQEREKAKEKTKMSKKNEIYRLKSIKAAVKKQEKEFEDRARKRRELKDERKNEPKRLGKNKFVPGDLELKLSDELEGSLRLLKPEGNLLEDRYKSFQKRNLIETRLRAKSTRKWKPKVFEKKGHKEITA